MSNGKLLHGQQLDSELGFATPFTQQMQDIPTATSHLGDLNTEITPEDANQSLVRVYVPPTSEIAEFFISSPGFEDLREGSLPDILESITINWEKGKVEGGYYETGDGVSAGSSPSLSLAFNGRAQSSVSVTPSEDIRIKSAWLTAIPVTTYLFFMPNNSTQADVLARLTALAGATVLAWPTFRPVAHTLLVTGERVAVAADANVQQHVAVSGSDTTYTWSEGEGLSKDRSTIIKTIRIPQTIHGVINVVNDFETETAVALAIAGWEAATNWPSREANIAGSGTATGGVNPNTFAATTPAVWPASGLRLYRLEHGLYRWGYSRYQATVVDFANIH